jgi:hypothetical protein
MQVGRWTTQGGKATNANQLFFQFGSVIGFTNTVVANGTAWSTSTIKFNPTSTASSSFAWTTIPNWNGSDTTDGYISSSSYHTVANVQAGRGDPCKLVGLTEAQVKSGVYDSGLYRLPTSAENGTYSSPTFHAGNGWTSGTTPTAGIYSSAGIATTFLPASGYRHVDRGDTLNIGYEGFWRSSRPSDENNAHAVRFYNGYAFTSYTLNKRYGFAVRCVPQ